MRSPVPAAMAAALLLLVPAALAPATPSPAVGAVAKAEAILHGKAVLGRDPAGWLAWARGLERTPAAPGLGLPLTEAVARLWEAVGARATPAQRADLMAAAAAVPPAEAAVLAPLVAATADAYVEQARLAGQLDWAGLQRDGVLLPPAAGEASVANAERLVGAVAAFRAQAEVMPGGFHDFRDPLGLVVLGGAGPHTYRPDGAFGDPVLLVDTAGGATVLTSAGGACPATALAFFADCNGLALSIAVTLGPGNVFAYSTAHGFAQGAGGFGGLGMLLAYGGNDTFTVHKTPAHGADLEYYIDGVVQGSGEGGVGLLFEQGGPAATDAFAFDAASDAFDTFAQGQGFGGLGGLGALVVADGADTYDAEVTCAGPSGQFCGDYVQGVALYPGVGLLVDESGREHARAVDVAPQEDYYSQAFAAFGGLALMYGGPGDGDFFGSATSTDPAAGSTSSLNCAFGTAEYAGAVAVFLKAGGNDHYYDETRAPAGSGNWPFTMAEGYSIASASLFWDVKGDDWHEMRAYGDGASIGGRGVGRGPLENSAVFLDTGGRDVYADGLGADNSVWGLGDPANPTNAGFGVDEDLVP